LGERYLVINNKLKIKRETKMVLNIIFLKKMKHPALADIMELEV